MRQRVREPRPQALRPGEEPMGAGSVPAVEGNARHEGIDERARRVLLHPRTADDPERPLRKLFGLDPFSSPDRDCGALAERHR
jgi:hypothetical protein